MVNQKKYVPDKNDIIWIDLNPTRGHEQADTRPVLVLTAKAYNEVLGLFVGCPITSKIKDYPFEVVISESKVNGVVLSDQIRSMDWRNRKPTFIQAASTDVVKEVERNIKLLLLT